MVSLEGTYFQLLTATCSHCNGRLGDDRMVVGFTITYAIIAYHH